MRDNFLSLDFVYPLRNESLTGREQSFIFSLRFNVILEVSHKLHYTIDEKSLTTLDVRISTFDDQIFGILF